MYKGIEQGAARSIEGYFSVVMIAMLDFVLITFGRASLPQPLISDTSYAPNREFSKGGNMLTRVTFIEMQFHVGNDSNSGKFIGASVLTSICISPGIVKIFVAAEESHERDI